MKKLYKALLSLNSLRKIIGFNAFSKAAKFNYHREINSEISHIKKVLILAPHPDDEVFGMGGMIAKLSKNEALIKVIYFCDGSGGIREGKVLTKSEKQKLVETRKREAARTGDILNINEQSFFGYPDNKLTVSQAAVKALEDLIKKDTPDIIFLTSFLDNHPDHRVVNQILLKALGHVSEEILRNIQIWAYEVWTPIYPNRIFSINDVAETKSLAIDEYKSQLETRGYKQAIFGLNQYRAEINGFEGYAEAFFATTPEMYKELYKLTNN